MEDILLVLNGGNIENAVEQAFQAAKSDSKKLKVLQILDSELYHYGHNDLVASRLSKRTFLLFIREQVLEEGEAKADELREKAHNMGVSLEIDSVETDDVVATVIAEAKKGYEKIFLPKEEKKLFPIFKKTIEQHLRREVSSLIISC